jgi:hypothetical protein
MSGLFAYHTALKACQSYATTFNVLRFKFRFNGAPCGFGSYFRRSAVFPYKLHLSQSRHSLMGDLLFEKTPHSFMPSIKDVPERKFGKLHRASCDSLPSKSACNFGGAGSDGLRVTSGLANRPPLWFRPERGVPLCGSNVKSKIGSSIYFEPSKNGPDVEAFRVCSRAACPAGQAWTLCDVCTNFCHRTPKDFILKWGRCFHQEKTLK